MAFFKLIRKRYPQHEKLCEESTSNNKPIDMEMLVDTDFTGNEIVFKLKYLGSSMIENNFTENVRSKTIDSFFKTAKEGNKKYFPTVILRISSNGITVTNSEGHDLLKLSIYRISNCCNDGEHRQVFSFISSDFNDILTCHAFLCPKRKIARNVTLAVGNAFNAAYQTWNDFTSVNEEIKEPTIQREPIEDRGQSQNADYLVENGDRLIDFDGDIFSDKNLVNTISNKNQNNWVLFEDVTPYSSY